MNVVGITQKGRDEERGRRPGAIINENRRTRRIHEAPAHVEGLRSRVMMRTTETMITKKALLWKQGVRPYSITMIPLAIPLRTKGTQKAEVIKATG